MKSAARVTELVNVESDSNERLSDAIVQFWIFVLDYDIGDSEYSNALVSALAVLGIDGGGGWKSPVIYTPMLSAVVTISKMIVLHRAFTDRKEQVELMTQEKVEERISQDEAEAFAKENAASHFELVQDMAN